MKTNPTFPPSRLTDPKRRAERDIYQAVEASSVPGRALYEVKAARNAKQVDILLWAEAVAAFGAQLKGGTYVIRDGELCLVTDQGMVPKPGLLAAVWDSVMAIPEFIQRKLGRGMYIIRTERDGSRGDEGRHDHLETLPRAPFFAPVSARAQVSGIAGGG